MYQGQYFDWVMNNSNQICNGWTAGQYTGAVVMNPAVKVEYDLAGFDNFVVNDIRNLQYYSFNEDVVLYDISTEGYNFFGWYLSSDYSGNPITGWEAQEMFGTVRLYAKITWAVLDQIKTMTQPGMVTVTGPIGLNELLLISNAIASVNTLVSLDLSQTQGLTEIPSGVFTEVNNLDTLILPDSVKTLGSINDDFSYDLRVFGNIRSITMPGVEVLGDLCFQGCQGLVEIVIPDSVKQIGIMCFGGCGNLETLIMGNGITEIPDFFYESSVAGVFGNCDNLKTVKLSDNLRYIGAAAFEGCDSLETITIPASVEELGCVYTTFYQYLYIGSQYQTPSYDYGCTKFPAFHKTLLKNIIFENPEGWYIVEDWELDSAIIEISADDLRNSSRAAELISGTGDAFSYKNWDPGIYAQYKWKRSN